MYKRCYISILLVYTLSIFQQATCMNTLSKLIEKKQQEYKKYKDNRDVEAAFNALEQKNYAKLAKLRQKNRIRLYSTNQQDVMLITRVIETNHPEALAALMNQKKPARDYRVNESFIRLLMRYPECCLNRSIDSRALQDFREETLDSIIDKTAPQLDRKNIVPFDRNEMLTYTLTTAITAHQITREDLNALVTVGADDFINRPHSKHACPYLHEHLWMYNLSSGSINTTVLAHMDTITSFLFPYLSSRAFEHIDYLYNNDPYRAQYYHKKHADWKAMSQERRELIKQFIHPCEGIIQEFLEGDESQQLLKSIKEVFQERSIPELQLSPSIAHLIMQYTGIYGKCDA